MQDDEVAEKENPLVGGRYAKYVLFVLVLVYIFNFIDRQILSILAEEIKADIGISDAEIGFLYGTAFAVFYAVFGIPLGRLADTWVRKSLISMGLMFWSLMTVLSGTARSFGMLATYRIGVGVGEASATPAAFSMLSDYFPPKLRTTAIAIYSSGVYIGAGIGIFLGGIILDGWTSAFPESPPLGLKGWHVAFFVVGMPGLLMAAWVWTLKEPIRGMSEGIITPPHPHPFRETWNELTSILPPLHFYTLWKTGAGIKGFAINLLGAVTIGGGSWYLYELTGSAAQWGALGLGVYAGFCWVQLLAIRDPATFAMIFKVRTVMLTAVGFPCCSFITYGLGFWGPPFFQRVHEASASEVGIVLGLGAAVGGWIGVTTGGVLADYLRRYTVRGKLYIGLLSVTLSLPIAAFMLTTENLIAAYVANFFFSITSPMWVGPAAATVNDLVMPRMRAIASAFYIMMVTFIGLSLGPYTIGQISDLLFSEGQTSAEALTTGMLTALGVYAVAFTCILVACFVIDKDESSRLERAGSLGENIA